MLQINVDMDELSEARLRHSRTALITHKAGLEENIPHHYY